MGDTSNWEFAAAVAAVSMGLGGLLLFTLIGTLGSWRVFSQASRAAAEAAKASIAMQDLARTLAARSNQQLPYVDLREAAGDLSELRQQADALIAQQGRLQDAVRNLVEAGVLGNEDTGKQYQGLESAIGRLDDNMTRLAAAIAELGQRS